MRLVIPLNSTTAILLVMVLQLWVRLRAMRTAVAAYKALLRVTMLRLSNMGITQHPHQPQHPCQVLHLAGVVSDVPHNLDVQIQLIIMTAAIALKIFPRLL